MLSRNIIISILLIIIVILFPRPRFDPFMESTDTTKEYIIWAIGEGWRNIQVGSLIYAWNLEHPKALIKESDTFRNALSIIYNAHSHDL